MLEHIERLPHIRDRSIFVGNPDDIVPRTFGKGLPSIRKWTEAHNTFSGYIQHFDPRRLTDGSALRSDLGLSQDGRVVVASAGGTAVDRGIHPAVLGDRGLVDAIEGRVARLPLEVRIEAKGITRETRFVQEVEGAAYYLISEALTNTLKHASARFAQVRLVLGASVLQIEVADDGIGFDADRPRHGLRGLVDRVEALGGSLTVTSLPEPGTRLLATIPAVPVQEKVRV
jgi:hypothetical protein